MRATLPDWTIEPLKMAGMSAKEIESMVSEVSLVEQKSGLNDLEQEADRMDQQIEEAENQLISSSHKSLDCVATVLGLAVDRLRRQVSTDPNDVFYDYGEARVMFMLESAVDDLRGYMQIDQRAAG